jgi:hypothetical protein
MDTPGTVPTGKKGKTTMPETTTNPARTPAQPAALAARVLWEHAETIEARQAEAIKELLTWARQYRQQQEQRP